MIEWKFIDQPRWKPTADTQFCYTCMLTNTRAFQSLYSTESSLYLQNSNEYLRLRFNFMAIWHLHYAFINDDVRVQFYFIRVLMLTSFGGSTTCYNCIRVSSNNPIKMSDVFCTTSEHTHNRDHAHSTFYAVRETSAKIRSACVRNEIQYTERKTGKHGPMYNYMYNFIWHFFYTSCAIKTQDTSNNRKIHTKCTFNMKCFKAGSKLFKAVSHVTVTLWRHRHRHVPCNRGHTADAKKGEGSGVHPTASLHVSIGRREGGTAYRPRKHQCV
jgi:hypothetical protein